MATHTSRRGMLKVPEVCDELGISRSTFYEWRLKHRAPAASSSPTVNFAYAAATWTSG